MSTLSEQEFRTLALAVAINKHNRTSVNQCVDQLKQGFVEVYRIKHCTALRDDLKPLVARYMVYLHTLINSRPKAEYHGFPTLDWAVIDEKDREQEKSNG